MKKKNYKRLLLVLIPIFVISILVLISIMINNKNDARGVFSVLEKRWIEKNQSEIIDVGITNDLPVFGQDGDGVFFDYLNDFTKENNIKFNMLPYSINKKSSTNKYYFEINNKSKLSDNELLFYRDNFVIVSKDNNKIKDISELSNTTLAALESDLNVVKNYFSENNQIIYNSYTNISSIVTSLNNNDVSYAIIPKNLYIEEIFKNNYYIVYNAHELSTNYILKVNGDNSVLNSILRKFYTRWSNKKLSKSYNSRIFDLYFDKKEIDDVTKSNFLSKEYTYGFVKNLPYESKINTEFIGYNSEILDDFSKRMGITFKIKEFSSVEKLTKALNNGKIDVAFNYYNYNDLDTNNFDNTFSPYTEKIVVLSHQNNSDVSIFSLKSLKSYDVAMIDSKLSNYIKNNYELKFDKYKNDNALFRSVDVDDILVLDYNTYNYYRNTKLNDYQVLYEDYIDISYNFIVLNSNVNKAFNGLFKYYLSDINSSLYQVKAYKKLKSDEKMIDMKYIYAAIFLVFLLIAFSLLYKKSKTSKIVKKAEKIKYVDYLTSLKNRNYLNQNYPKWQQNKIYPQAIIIIELNKVGHINDVYGHEEGDMVIKKAANILITNQLEQSDIVRTNGDEFLIYLVGYEENKVISYMRKLYKEFKTLPYGFGVLLGYSMILDDVKTIDDAMNEAVLEIKTSKEMNNAEDE